MKKKLVLLMILLFILMAEVIFYAANASVDTLFNAPPKS